MVAAGLAPLFGGGLRAGVVRGKPLGYRGYGGLGRIDGVGVNFNRPDWIGSKFGWPIGEPVIV